MSHFERMPWKGRSHMGQVVSRAPDRDAVRPLVAFDFDGTLTCRDSFLAFLAWRAGAGRYAAGVLRSRPTPPPICSILTGVG